MARDAAGRDVIRSYNMNDEAVFLETVAADICQKSASPALIGEEQALTIFRASGLTVELGGSPYSVRGQTAGLLKGVQALTSHIGKGPQG